MHKNGIIAAIASIVPVVCICRTTASCTVAPSGLIGFNYAKTATDKETGIHFFVDDCQFERTWNKPGDCFDLLRSFGAMRRLEPSRILLYGGDMGFDYGGCEVVRYENGVTERMKHGR